MTTLRLLKVLVQPVFVLDDGESLVEHAVPPVVVTAADWPTYATTTFVEDFARLRLEVEGPPVQVVPDEASA